MYEMKGSGDTCALENHLSTAAAWGATSRIVGMNPTSAP
jgi:hypothetical protein